jgi:repressor LexA
MMPEPLTKLERRILDYLVDYLRRNTYQPSIREIGRRFDIKSTKTVSEYLQSLADKGWIERDPSRSRGVKLLGIDLNPQTVTVPCYDAPGDAAAASAGELELDRRLAGGMGAFCLAAAGEDLAAFGIREGDLLLAEPALTEELEDRDLVIVRIGGPVTVRRFFRRDNGAVLEPATADYPPALLRAGGSVVVLGRVVSLIRRLRVPALRQASLSNAEVAS